MKIDTSAVLKTIQVRKTSAAWSRLVDLAREQGDIPPSLHTNDFQGLLNCCRVWLQLNDTDFKKRGNVFEFEHLKIEIIHPEGPSKTQQKRREQLNLKGAVTVRSFSEFLAVYDDHF